MLLAVPLPLGLLAVGLLLRLPDPQPRVRPLVRRPGLLLDLLAAGIPRPLRPVRRLPVRRLARLPVRRRPQARHPPVHHRDPLRVRLRGRALVRLRDLAVSAV